MTDRCNKPLPGGRFLCSREAGHEGRCLRSVHHCTLFEPGDTLYAPGTSGPWLTREAYEEQYGDLGTGRCTVDDDRAVVTGIDRENGVVTVSSMPKESE